MQLILLVCTFVCLLAGLLQHNEPISLKLDVMILPTGRKN